MLTKKILFICAAIAVFVVAASSQKLAGNYEFNENGGKTTGGTVIFIAHVLDLGSDGTATLTANGYQTARDLKCTFTTTAAKTVVTFDSYNADGVNSFEPYKKGDVLLTLQHKTVKGKKVLWTTFGKYTPTVKNAPKAGGIYFKAAKN